MIPEELKVRLAVAVIAAAFAYAMFAWREAARRTRLIGDIPTSRAGQVTLGLNEVVGVATSDNPVIAPESGIECVWWKHEVFKTDSEKGRTRVKERTGGPGFFYVSDDSGRVRVWARNAEVTARQVFEGNESPEVDASLVSRYVSAQYPRVIVETVIEIGAPTYVLGTARLPDHGAEAEISYDARGRDPLLIALGSEADILTRHRFLSWLFFAAAAVCAAALGVAWVVGGRLLRNEIAPVEVAWWPMVAGLWFFGLLAGMLSLAIVYNGLVELRNRAQRAWSLIDVELRRRQDLIPELTRLADGHRQFEAEVQGDIATLRTRVGVIPAEMSDGAVPAVDIEMAAQSGALNHLLGVAEAYPELGSDQTFARLRAELAETENRIGAARRFYNLSVEALRDQAQTVPRSWVAWLFEMELGAAFEMAPAGERSIIEPKEHVF